VNCHQRRGQAESTWVFEITVAVRSVNLSDKVGTPPNPSLTAWAMMTKPPIDNTQLPFNGTLCCSEIVILLFSKKSWEFPKIIYTGKN